MGSDERALAAAGVHHQAEGERNIHAAGKEGNLLKHAIFQHLEVFPGEGCDQLALRVAHGEADVDQLHVGAKLGLLAGAAERQQAQAYPKPDRRHTR